MVEEEEESGPKISPRGARQSLPFRSRAESEGILLEGRSGLAGRRDPWRRGRVPGYRGGGSWVVTLGWTWVRPEGGGVEGNVGGRRPEVRTGVEGPGAFPIPSSLLSKPDCSETDFHQGESTPTLSDRSTLGSRASRPRAPPGTFWADGGRRDPGRRGRGHLRARGRRRSYLDPTTCVNPE